MAPISHPVKLNYLSINFKILLNQTPSYPCNSISLLTLSAPPLSLLSAEVSYYPFRKPYLFWLLNTCLHSFSVNVCLLCTHIPVYKVKPALQSTIHSSQHPWKPLTFHSLALSHSLQLSSAQFIYSWNGLFHILFSLYSTNPFMPPPSTFNISKH